MMPSCCFSFFSRGTIANEARTGVSVMAKRMAAPIEKA